MGPEKVVPQPPPGRDTEVKFLVEEAKARVRATQAELEGLNASSHPIGGFWPRKNELKKRLAEEQTALGKLKAELQALCGTTGKDPKWVLLAKAHRVLTRLDDAGTDIGEDGQLVLDEIEFHVAPALLMQEVT